MRIYIIDATDREVIIPKNLSESQQIKKVGEQEVIITETREERMFGGSFTKLFVRGAALKMWVSASLSKEELSNIIQSEYGFKAEDIFSEY